MNALPPEARTRFDLGVEHWVARMMFRKGDKSIRRHATSQGVMMSDGSAPHSTCRVWAGEVNEEVNEGRRGAQTVVGITRGPGCQLHLVLSKRNI